MTRDLTRGRSRAELDSQFTLDSIPDLVQVTERRAAAARIAMEQFDVIRDIPYGSGPYQTLNLFPPISANGAVPLQIFIHGGFWRTMEAAQFSFLARGIAPFGAALAVIDYPLIPTVRLANIVESCRAAIAWAHRHGAEHGIDPDRIFISGNSAGGHLVAEMLDRGWTAEAGLPPDVVKGGTAVSGLYDLAPVAASFQNDFLHLTDGEVAQFSPLRRTLDIQVPVIATVGGNEADEFLQQTQAFAAVLRGMKVEVTHLVVPDTDHITIVLDALADPAATLNRKMRWQMGIL